MQAIGGRFEPDRIHQLQEIKMTLNEVEHGHIDTILATSDDVYFAGLIEHETGIGIAVDAVFRFINDPNIVVKVDITDYSCW